MPIQAMMCPKCGESASEYDANKWQCLSCGAKFVYEPPQEADFTVREVVEFSEKGLLYSCPKCGKRISAVLKPPQSCRCCGRELCPDCFDVESGVQSIRGEKHKGLCIACSDELAAPARMRARAIVWAAAIAVIVLAVLMFRVMLESR
jgi:hypothetical protein